MARILFTDGIGTAQLDNAKIGPGARFGNWTPMTRPIGDSANRDSDGALYMMKRRTDYGASFELAAIPGKELRPNLLLTNGDIEGSVGATPTGMTPVAPNLAAVVVGLHSGAPGQYGKNSNVAKHTRDTGTGDTNVGGMSIASITTGQLYTGRCALLVPSSSTATAIQLAFEFSSTGLVTGVADLSIRDRWQVLSSSATSTVTGTGGLVLRVTGPTGAICYSDDWQIDDLTAGLYLQEIADRLVAWLLQGGTCTVDPGDYVGTPAYTNCSLMPGTTPQLVLSDRRELEYTLTLSLINLAGAQMTCRYQGIPS